MLVDLGSLKDTVPTDRIVVLGGGWSLFGKGSAGEILLRLTYKAYVEDEEDERFQRVSRDTEVSEDDLSDSDESEASISGQRSKDYLVQSDRESFMDVLAALLVSEEFRGIVTSEAVSTKSSDTGRGSDSLEPNGRPVGSVQKSSENESFISGGSVLFWLAFITSISVLIAINMGGSSLFNP